MHHFLYKQDSSYVNSYTPLELFSSVISASFDVLEKPTHCHDTLTTSRAGADFLRSLEGTAEAQQASSWRCPELGLKSTISTTAVKADLRSSIQAGSSSFCLHIKGVPPHSLSKQRCNHGAT